MESSSPCHGVRLATHMLAISENRKRGDDVPVDAFDRVSLLTSCPLLETGLMDVVATGCLAPYYLFGV